GSGGARWASGALPAPQSPFLDLVPQRALRDLKRRRRPLAVAVVLREGRGDGALLDFFHRQAVERRTGRSRRGRRGASEPRRNVRSVDGVAGDEDAGAFEDVEELA